MERRCLVRKVGVCEQTVKNRSKIGNINVKSLKLGEWRYLKSSEVESLIK